MKIDGQKLIDDLLDVVNKIRISVALADETGKLMVAGYAEATAENLERILDRHRYYHIIKRFEEDRDSTTGMFRGKGEMVTYLEEKGYIKVYHLGSGPILKAIPTEKGKQLIEDMEQ